MSSLTIRSGYESSMPQQYESIRDSLPKSMPLKERKTRAAKIFIAKGRGMGGRSGRARALAHARKTGR